MLLPFLWALAASMALVTAWVLKYVANADRALDYAIALFVLAMMAAMFGGALIYLNKPGVNSLELAVWMNMGVMSVGSIPIFNIVIRTALDKPNQGVQYFSISQQRLWLVKAFVITLVVLNESLMGWALLVASNTGLTVVQVGSSIEGAFSNVTNSYWFLFSMSLEMGLSVYMLRKWFSKGVFAILVSQSLIMFLSPTAINSGVWHTASVWASSVAMIGLFVFIFEYLYRHKSLNLNVANYLLRLFFVYGAMMAGLFLWELTSNGFLFALSVIAEMGLYFELVLSHSRFSDLNASKFNKPPTKSWLLDPIWTFGLLVSMFIAEFFMGGLLDVQAGGQAFLNSIHTTPVAGSVLSQLGAAFYNFVQVFSSVTNSVWFYVMMGAEMGVLVLFKLRSTRELETKIRLILLVLAYAFYTVFFPYFYFGGNTSKIPFMGWSMGIGTGGAFAPALMLAIGGTYAISGFLSFLFGGRQMCSVFCTAPLMYQGTTYDSMKTFNRSSKLGRKLLTSRMNNIYLVTTTLTWVSLIVVSLVSYLDSVGRLNLTVFGSDPSVFLYNFYFNFLWYIIFISMPFVGNYACVTTGYCHWGSFNRLVGRLGFFRLKVRDKEVCRKCPTKDCAKACPVGLTDMPGHFITKGEFRSQKCCGVGDCVGACPYGNMYFYDVRDWLREKFGAKKRRETIELAVIQK
jgi:polyferredoxin